MVTRVIPLSKSAEAEADDSGKAVVAIGPTTYGDVWTITNVMVQNSTPGTSANSPSAILTIAGVAYGGTVNAVADSDSVSATIRQGQTAVVSFSGCDPGSTCTISVYGSRAISGG